MSQSFVNSLMINYLTQLALLTSFFPFSLFSFEVIFISDYIRIIIINSFLDILFSSIVWIIFQGGYGYLWCGWNQSDRDYIERTGQVDFQPAIF